MTQTLKKPIKHLEIRTYRRLAHIHLDSQNDLQELLWDLGLSSTEFDLLALVSVNAGIAQQDLAAGMLVSAPNITYHVQRLTQRGLLERTSSGKFKCLHLTPAGKTLMDQAFPRVIQHHAEQFSGLSRDELQTLSNLLQRVKKDRDSRKKPSRAKT
ncbi:MarR family winged helix-turn-helix transcriptional regulator [Deinococcus roseus]|uniref:MarR family transcriptional regulator n=1 Tax=Deinococcus roseus TaxID=392414 RepID=A0ABQ2CXP9_9DEIO|nr:MarR family transcriptional regulator [Deinococcus roseus]GGJ27423.1 MarR family transcriptional regulator [Deinococcus roseus]